MCDSKEVRPALLETINHPEKSDVKTFLVHLKDPPQRQVFNPLERLLEKKEPPQGLCYINPWCLAHTGEYFVW